MPDRSVKSVTETARSAIGERVTVRLYAGGIGPSGGPAMRDVVGVLSRAADPAADPAAASRPPASADDGQWAVERSDGRIEHFSLDQVVVIKVIPPRTMRRPHARDVEIVELEHIAARGWQPIDHRALGGWMLRAAEGFTGRANSVLPLGSPATSLDDALAQVLDWYNARGLVARFQVPLPYASSLDDSLATRGWSAYNPTLVLVADLEQVRLAQPHRPDLPPAEVADVPSPEWLATYSYRGEVLPPIAHHIMVKADHARFASVRDSTLPAKPVVAVARAATTDRWVGITAVDVVASARRRGLATHTMRALFDDAYAHGARHAYLQVAEENVAAQAMYDGLGFVRHHTYHYRLAPQGQPQTTDASKS